MTNLDLDTSVVEWVIDHPEVQCLLESLGIDQSCPGRSLGFVCRQMDLEPNFVLKQLQAIIADRSTIDD